MVLEATYLCVDNSDYMRNGDFAPSRMEAQQDAVNLLAGAKTPVLVLVPFPWGIGAFAILPTPAIAVTCA